MVFDIDYIGLFGTRIAALREQKGVSAREMSLALGQSESYINKIENKRTFPSMSGFIYICEYLEVTPAEFFDFSIKLNFPTELSYTSRGRDFQQFIQFALFFSQGINDMGD